MNAIIPFRVNYVPMKKLALISFAKNPDILYRGFELQYLDGKPYGTGWRVLAYRNDYYVDVYDDLSLNTIENERFDVAEKGLKNYTKREFREMVFEKTESGILIGFSFLDISNRNIYVNIKENTDRVSKAMNMLAPVGAGSEKPSSLPLFFLYEFDFVRKRKTDIIIEIDGKKYKADNFPFPVTKELQWRYYTRYSMDCQIIEFAKADEGKLIPIELTEDFTYTDGQITYSFTPNNKNISLKSIVIDDKRHPVEIEFHEPILTECNQEVALDGRFHVTTETVMGTVKGTYQLELANGVCKFSMSPDEGWKSVPNSFLTKMILSSKSIFCTWPKTYWYEQVIDMNNMEARSRWIKK
ncbi:hypothetical protein I5677_05060 [Mobilitalea sibirica]|uniref:Uncharacterized protein n=1 Tax=Mobilitalea sibirica TaxID=1462919 RepID=A0A8J7H8H7_9FIRM|nr:hypothetical protein [Mobilitalea sibirica]MBH1940265.1 hypothetical protein [Mobilitalea sibirica]